ncbi:muts domain V-domain-containing protein [Jimgerdemannia flammicorona]|uniref:Muts domain V-domain-containing protein n=1 Tax=Jimgerdemannia flammicorona TaxID=994334 RepID=A0A433CXT2_9FUNG|nr:muts domain V-domain-containing protein [Jimgerdemannia flammicorona]
MNVEEIEKRQDLVEIFAEDTELRQSLQEDHLKSVPDLHRLAKRFQRGVATLQDVVRMYQVVIRLPGLLACLESYSGMDERLKDLLETTYITKLKEYSGNLENLQELVETTIDLAAVEDHEFLIKAEFDETLQELRARIKDVRNQMDREHARVGDKLNLETEKKLKMEKHTVYGYCFRVMRQRAYEVTRARRRMQDAAAIRNKSEYHEYTTQKAGTYFATSKMRDLNQTWNELSAQYDRKQNDLVKEVITIVGTLFLSQYLSDGYAIFENLATYCPVVETLGGLIAHLDVLIRYVGSGPFGNFWSKSEFQIITGPNMGGKSTYIRQIGVIALMAQTGCFVPCSEATLCVFDSILARVGAGDSQLKGVSTFMAEMLETATILKVGRRSATANSLIVIDELGRGTSTYDGFGLAWAISEYIASEIQCFCLFATHFHELTALGEKVPHVRNLNVAVHVGECKNGNGGRDITLLYKVNEGMEFLLIVSLRKLPCVMKYMAYSDPGRQDFLSVCDQSFGIHVAELANFPETVVKLAKRKAYELEDTEEVDLRATKCSRADIDEGNAVIERCLAEFAATPDLEALDHAVLLERLRGVKNKYKGELEANPYVKEVLAGL